MTIQTTANKTFGLGNGLTTNFNFNFLLPNASQLVVQLTDNTVNPPTTVTLNPNTYNLTGVGVATGGTVTYPLAGPPLAAGQNLTISRIVPLSQLASIRNQNGYYPGVIEDALDYLTMITQQLQEITARAFTLAITDTSGASPILAAPVAGGVIAWDATGLKLTNAALAAAGIVALPLNAGLAVYAGNSAFGTSRVLTAGAGLQVNNGDGIAANPTILVPAGAITGSMLAPAVVIPAGGSLGNGVTAATQAQGDSSTKAATDAFVQGAGVPVGAVIDFATPAPPANWLDCNQGPVSRATYATLFAAIGTTWGVGDGATTFSLPPPGRLRAGYGTVVTSETIATNVASNAQLVGANNAKWISGMCVRVSSSGVLPTGLAVATDYFLYRVDSTHLSFCTTLANAQNGTVITLTGGSGSGNITITTAGATAQSFATHTVGEVDGEEKHAMSSTELLSHSHRETIFNAGGGGNIAPANISSVSSIQNSSYDTVATGGNVGGNVQNPVAYFMTCIKYQ
jgi:microcystin-dependent protein